MSLCEGEQADEGCKKNTMPKSRAKNFPFFADQPDGGNANGDVLRRDHFSGDGTGGVGGREKDGIQMQLVRRSDLQIAKEEIACCIAAAQKAGGPSEIAADQRKESARGGHCRSQRERHSGIIVKIGERDDEYNRESGEAKLTQRLVPRGKKNLRAYAQANSSEHDCEESGGAGGKRLESIHGGVRLSVKCDEHGVVQVRNGETGLAFLEQFQVRPENHHCREKDPRQPGGKSLRSRNGRRWSRISNGQVERNQCIHWQRRFFRDSYIPRSA